MKKLRLVHVCLITLLTPLLFSINSTNPYAQSRRASGGSRTSLFTRSALNQLPPHGKPFVDIHAPMPPSVMHRPMAAGPKTRAGAPVAAQTIDLTPNTPTVQDVNPYWSKDEQTIIFQSNRVDLFGTTAPPAGSPWHVYTMRTDGSGISALTGPLANPAVGQNASQTEPAFNTGTSTVVYVETDSSGAVDLIEYNLATKATRSLVRNNPNSFSFVGLNHPEYGTGGVVFAGQTGATDQPFHLYSVDSQSGQVVQLTTGIADDRNPTLSPDPNKPVIIFDSNRSNAAGTAVKATRDIWAIGTNPNIKNARQVTNFSAAGAPSDNIEPAWSTNKVDQPTGPQQIVNGQQLIAFTSTRYDAAGDGNANAIGNRHNIYWLKVNVGVDPSNPTVFTVLNPANPSTPTAEDPSSNAALKLDTGNHAPNAHVPIYEDRHPTWPQFISTYRVAYHSDRAMYNPADGTSGPAGQPSDVFASTLIDLNAPTLIRFDVVTGDVASVQPRQTAPGSTVKISVKVADFETGVNSVYVQVKNPSSKYQSSDGKEHKVFLNTNLIFDGTNVALGYPVEYESQRIYIGSDPTDPRVNTYAPPRYIASVDDFFAFTGSTHPADTGWLPLALESRDATTGISTYSANYTTDIHPSDYYIDVIVYDNAVNPFAPTASKNWKIYDNVWGFSTQSFLAAHNILFVSDYACGQKFFSSRFGTSSLTNVFNSFWGAESWMTDFDISLIDGLGYVPKTGGTGGTLYNIENALGVKSYGSTDARDPWSSLAADPSTWDGTRVDGADVPNTQQYDLWRILSRGPVPDTILQQYAAHQEQQPPDTYAGEKNPRTVTVANRCVIWHAPYSGDVFTGAGAITDLQTQLQLHSFLTSGGRLFVNGQDIGWALTLDGTVQNSFFVNDLKSKYVDDQVPGAINIVTAGGFVPYILHVNAAFALGAKGRYNPITHDPFLNTANDLALDPPHIYPGPPFPPGYKDNVSNEQNFLNAGTDPNSPHELASPGVFYSDEVQPLDATVSADLTYANGNAALLHYPMDPTAAGSPPGRVVYCPMGLEGLNPDQFNPPNTQNTIAFKNRRSEIMHNIVCWLRTGTVTGRVVDTEAGAPLANVLVRLSNRLDQNGNPITKYTALTRSDGTYSINGVEADQYSVTASKPGFTTQHRDALQVHGGYRTDESFRMTTVEPAVVKGKVTRTDGTTPVVGATVKAVDNNDTSGVFTATTDSNGDYTLSRLPANTTYTLTVSAPGFGASIPTSYQVPNPNDPITSQRDSVVQPAKVYLGFDFKLKPVPGSIIGHVKRKSDGAPIAGATVTATDGAATVTAVTDANGQYSFDVNNTPPNGLDPGTVSLVATAPGYAPNNPALTVTVVTAQTTNAPDILLDTVPPGSVSGLVTRTSDNSALAGVLIQLKDPAGNIVASTTTGTPQTVSGYTFNYKLDNVPAGVTYTVTATKAGFTSTPPSQSAAVTSNTETQSINFTMDPLHTFAGALSLVSAPYDYSGFDVADLLSIPAADRTNGAFKFATWVLGGYVFYPNPPANTFRLGRGYFLGYTTNLPLSQQGTAADPTLPFDINLDPGWNLIGDPFNIDIDWTKVDVIYNGQVVPHDTAVAQGLIGAAPYSYVAGQYVLDFKLSPWKGYWVRAFQNVTLHVDPVNDAFGRAASLPPSRAILRGGDGWTVNLRVQAGNLLDTYNQLGEASRAADGYDAFKVEKPPIFGDKYLTLTFDHDTWGDKSGGYGVDVRSVSNSPKSWQFTVKTSAINTTATLSWPDVAGLSRKTTLTLTDLATGAAQDLRTSSSYTWQTGDKPSTRKFRIDVAPADRNVLRVTNVVARPTDSRAAGVPGVSISYSLSTAANVEVRILGSDGSTVRRLSGRATRAAGINQVTWDQRNDHGATIPAGVYQVEIRAQSADGKTSARQIAPLILTR